MDTWDFMQNWNYVLPPSRPSAYQLDKIRTLCYGIDRNAPVAVLGSTPEYRDLLYECGFSKIYILEKNIGFYKAMSNSRIYDNEEILIHGDWIETLPNLKKTFALILSDLTSGNLPYDIRADFYQMITDSLTVKGVFFDKLLTHPGHHIPFVDLIEKYASLPLNLLYINHFSSEMLFCSDLLDIKNLVDTSLFYTIMDQRVTNKRVRAFAEQARNKITPENCIWFYGRKWSSLNKDYCPSLQVLVDEREKEKTNPYFGRLRFFAFQKNS